jgi:transcriptional regulator with XRE-family HTH domain
LAPGRIASAELSWLGINRHRGNFVPVCIQNSDAPRLAYDAEVDRSYVGGLERQAENPTIDLLDRLAKTLEVPLSEFFVQPAKGATAPKPLPQGRKISRLKRKKP